MPRASRLPAEIQVEVSVPEGSLRRPGRVLNLNKSGMLVEHRVGVKPGESIGIEIPAGSDRGRVMVLGEVRWSSNAKTGIRVCGMMPHHRVRYEKLISNLAQGQSMLG